MSDSNLFEQLYGKIMGMLKLMRQKKGEKTGFETELYVVTYSYDGKTEHYQMTKRDVTNLVEELLNDEPIHIYYRRALKRLQTIEKSYVYDSLECAELYLALCNEMINLREKHSPSFGKEIIERLKPTGKNPLKELSPKVSNWLINKSSMKLDFRIKYTPEQITKLKEDTKKSMIDSVLSDDPKKAFTNPYLWGLLYTHSINQIKDKDISDPKSDW